MTNNILKNCYAVVSGSSSGIGFEIARRLAEAGADLFIHGGHSQQNLDAAVDQISGTGAEVHGLCVDLSSETGSEELYRAATSNGRIPDIWINNAGADVLTGSHASDDYYEKLSLLWNVDVLATIRLSKRIGSEMKKTRGTIINIGWDQVECGMEGDSGEIFCATKGAVMAFTRSLAKTFAPNVRVNCIAAGWIQTKWGETATDAWQQRATGESLRGRWGTPRDIAELALFLASPQSDFVTGQIIAVNGGRR